mmetsp:Transcript_29560/g.66902  ORF Transcript_29560/g.66902 Transcript_29560/m.66902 type:complete len:80 (+) Transcript_29560:395-634(+)
MTTCVLFLHSCLSRSPPLEPRVRVHISMSVEVLQSQPEPHTEHATRQAQLTCTEWPRTRRHHRHLGAWPHAACRMPLPG